MKKCCAVAILMLAGYAYADPATLSRESELRERPAIDALVIEKLPAGEVVEVVANQGGWSKIKSAKGKTGYVRLLNLRMLSKKDGNIAAGAGQLGNVIRTGSTGAVATTGVKGVTKEDIEKSTPNMAEVDKLEGYATTPDAARKNAEKNKIVAQNIPYIGTKAEEKK